MRGCGRGSRARHEHRRSAATSPPRKHRDACDPSARPAGPSPVPRSALASPRRRIPYPVSQTRYFIHARIVRPGLLLFARDPRAFHRLSSATARTGTPAPFSLFSSYHVTAFSRDERIRLDSEENQRSSGKQRMLRFALRAANAAGKSLVAANRWERSRGNVRRT